MNRGHGELNFHLTQVMSGHGCFNQYLHKMGIKESPVCSHCDQGQVDDPRHTLFECEAWQRERGELVQSLEEIGEEEYTVESLVPIMLRSEEGWNLVSGFTATIMKKKMDAEWAARE